ncbi:MULTISPECIES: hypothetical protein [unclassified Neptuniibacter]|uniref:hypothetical protein n=1 Tax=unclassified Neptuniibacter TaxID=2630693 RepID=UPI000C629D9F|nr:MULTISPECIES: hypothetical protein [unclassified Neptuniibacter]MAY43103.1 hypothetical protein [Oceanospirillaceae bacterium]|tara:strand:- start:1954 stop:2523 length:570 start_codon:yes stop_codon:yes gene_type:complete
MEHLVKIIDSVVWPIAAVWLGYIFKGELRALLGRMSQFKYKDVEAKFDKQLNKAEITASNLKKELPKNWEKATTRAALTQYEQFKRIAEASPRAAILEAWLDVEIAVSAAAEKAGLESNPRSPALLAEHLIALKHIPEETLSVFHSLRKLRNQATHMPDFTLTEEEAERYLDLALKVANTFRSYAVKNV